MSSVIRFVIALDFFYSIPLVWRSGEATPGIPPEVPDDNLSKEPRRILSEVASRIFKSFSGNVYSNSSRGFTRFFPKVALIILPKFL